MDKTSGLVTFLFTDIEGSTKLAQEYPDTLPDALKIHNSILQNAVVANNGFVFEIVGDAFCCAFQNAFDAVNAAVDAQINLANEKWKDAVIRIRIGIHSGNAEWSGERYMGYITLARTARVMSAAYGEQILISNDTYELIRDKFIPIKEKTVTFRDLGERRLKDVIQPIRLYQIISPELREEFPPLKTLDARPNNIPVQLTSFIGRETEIKQLKKMLRQSRLITLTGPGGAGKTRLALQVSADVIDDFSNGVWLLDLSSMFEPALLVFTILNILGLREEHNKIPEDVLFDYLKSKETLIIFDNCEQLVVPVSKLIEKLLSICPKLKILATSREALRCSGEQTYGVLSLKIPDPKEEFTTEQLSQYEAVRLFIERALAVDSNFCLTNENVPALAQICYQLDGIPLAIELAAARIKILSVEKIYERLNDRFSLLTGGMRTALPRQQTLKAMVDWSYELLSEKEKILWNRLSVFSNGWTLEAAEDVCSDEKINKYEVMDLLNQLADKSLVIPVSKYARYRMLETIRQYGEDNLISSNEIETIILRHLEYFLNYAETLRKKSDGEFKKQILDELECENSNFRVALVSSIIRSKRVKGIRLAVALSRFWEIRGYITEARNLFEEILDTNEEIPPSILANAYQWSGTFEWLTGNYDKSRFYYEKSLSIYKNEENKKGVGILLNNLGIIANARGDFEESKALTEESLNYFNEAGDDQLKADSLLNLGAPLASMSEFDYAEKVFSESLILYRKIRDLRGIAMALNNLATIAGRKKDYTKAVKILEESVEIQREIKDNRAIAMTLSNLGAILGYCGNYFKAEEYLEESLKISTELGDKHGLADSMNNLGFLKFTENLLSDSLHLHKESLKLNVELKDLLGISYSIIGIAEVICKKNPVNASLLLGKVIESLEISNDKIEFEIEKVLDNTSELLRINLGENYDKYIEDAKKYTTEEITEIALSITL